MSSEEEAIFSAFDIKFLNSHTLGGWYTTGEGGTETVIMICIIIYIHVGITVNVYK